MARSFNGTTDKLVKGSGTLFQFPITLACWFKADNTTTDGGLVYMASSTNNGPRIGLATQGTAAGDPILAQTIDVDVGTPPGNAFSTTGYSAGVWHHACGVFPDLTSRTAYLDGGSSATNSDAQNSVSFVIDRMSVGNLERLTPALFFDGDIMEVGVWWAAPTAAEVLALAKGLAPPLVRPSSLVCWMPLMGNANPEQNRYKTGDLFTVTGTAPADHGRMFYPASPIIGKGGSGDSFVSVCVIT